MKNYVIKNTNEQIVLMKSNITKEKDSKAYTNFMTKSLISGVCF